jgi:Predicted glycosyl hydrolase
MKPEYAVRAACALLTAAILLPSILSCAAQNGETTMTDTSASTAEQTSAANTSAAETTASAANSNADTAVYCAERAVELGKNIIDKYMLASKFEKSREVYFVERVSMSNGHKVGLSSVWHYTSAMAMIGSLAAITGGDDSKYFSDLYSATFDSLQFYSGTAPITTYNGTPTLTMYAVDRAKTAGSADISGVKAVYDDQMWIVRDLVKAYDRTGEQKYLNEAIRLADLCIGGWDTSLKSGGSEYGGIPWGPGYSSKHTCSNAPLIEPLVRIYEILTEKGDTGAKNYLDWADKIYKFCLRFQKDDGTFGDMVGCDRKTVTENGVTKYVTTSQSSIIDQSAYSYNTGAMISGGAALYRVIGLEQYKNRAIEWASSAYRVFTKTVDGQKEYTSTSTLWFNLILLEGFLDLAQYDSNCDKYIKTYLTSLDYAYENNLKDGLLPRDWLSGWNTESEDDKNTSIMDQDSAAEIYALLSEYYSG